MKKQGDSILKKPRIYIVEDDPIIAATIETALQKQGYKIIGDSENYATALQQIRELKPDLILLDIQLEGDKDGVDLAVELDKEDVPYLYLTSQTDPETISRVKKTKPLGYIVKPFTENGLRSNIELAWHNLSLTAKEFSVLSGTPRNESEELLNGLSDKGTLKKLTTKNGAIWTLVKQD